MIYGRDRDEADCTRADAVCSERHRAVAQAYDDAREGGARGLALDEATNSAQIEGESRILRELREIDAPEGLEAAYSEFLTTHEQRRDVLEAAQKALQRRDSAAAAADGQRVSALQDEVYALGRALGLKTCAGAIPADQEVKARAAVERALTDRGASSIEILEIEGNTQYAEAEALSTGGDFDSEVVNVHANRDGEMWSAAEVEQLGGR